MPDYGQPLRFGTFITPIAAPAHRAVDLARASEAAGLDLVSFQDHPYQASFLDTWTLLAWVASRTRSIQVSANVLSLPLRPPAVLARAAASLDLLSDGRLALALGAGAYWDAIAAMGGGRKSAGQSVSALDEALDIIRGLWDAGARTPLSAGGEFYRVDGVQRGPAPAHDIPIWLGARMPRMLRMVGRKADGWLPPGLPFLQPGDISRGNAVIDKAAVAAGRDPRGITRLLNVTEKQTAEDLARFALEDGVSVFILIGADDPKSIARFAHLIVPEARERVADARASRGSGSAALSETSAEQDQHEAAPSRRHSRIEDDAVPASLAERAVRPGDRDYPRYTATFLRSGSPALVLRPQNVGEVRDSVRFAAHHRHVPLGILSAGHGLSGRSINHGGLVIDVSAIDHVEPLEGRRVRVGPGARWLDVAKVLTPLGLAITSGDYGGVGVGGLATAGGLGWFAREHGLTIDHLRAVDVVTADGVLVHTDEHENTDLFWAMRGAGANFGVAVSFEFEATPVGTVAFGQLTFAFTDAADFVQRWGAAIEASDRSVTAEVTLGATRPGQLSYAQAGVVVNSDHPDTVNERLQPLLGAGRLVQQTVSLVSYEDVIGAYVDETSSQQGQGEPHAHSAFVRQLDAATSGEIGALLESGASHFFTIRSVGGAVADVPAEATAYGWRAANFSLVAFGSPRSDFDERWTRLQSHAEGMYLSFETDTGAAVVARAFPPGHLSRLRVLKRRYDPTGLFRDNFFIDPASTGLESNS